MIASPLSIFIFSLSYIRRVCKFISGIHSNGLVILTVAGSNVRVVSQDLFYLILPNSI
jgi:hypothetical protein